MKRLIFFLLLLITLPLSYVYSQVTVTGAHALSNGTYSKLSSAFTAINNQSQSGNNIVVTITSSPVAETVSAVLNSGTWTSLVIYPTTSGLLISGNITTPLLDLNGADNVTIDGRVMQTGNTVDLTINNSSTSNASSTSTIRFINDATNNIIKYCNLKGSSTGGVNGIVFFSTTTGSIGNDNNTIDNNNITSSVDANRPINGIYSSGTISFDNSGIIISNNKIYNNFHRSASSAGINIVDNNTAWTISGNSFYETSTFVPVSSVLYYVILINSPTGVNFSVVDNFIGGRSASCGGSPWTKTNTFNSTFYGISLYVGTGTASNIQNNTIRNFDWSNSLNGSWTGILVGEGDVNVGTASGNTIGNTTGNGSILLTSTTTDNNVFCIYLSGTGSVDCRNNNIGSITTANVSSNASNIYGIYKNTTAGTATINDNIIGSTTTTNSIYASSGSTGDGQTVIGILNAGSGNINISGNTIANMTNGSTNTTYNIQGVINGISSTNGALIISDNTIYNLTNSNNYIYANRAASVCGLALTGNLQKTVIGNIIYNLSNTYSSFAGSVIGLYLSGGTGNVISSNFIHSLSVDVTSSASLHGMNIGTATSVFSNNIISLGGNTPTTVYGIYQTGTTGYSCSLYFNTVYIGGNPSSGANRSYALYSTGYANARDYRNNILVNSRSTTGGSNLHFTEYIVQAGGTITCSHNDYLVTGAGGTLGYYGALKPTLPIVTGQDVGSLSVDPVFVLPGGTTASDYIPSDSYLLAAITGTGITTDFAGTIRSLALPAMGAWEVTTLARVEVYKSAVLQGGFSTLKEAFDALNSGTINTGDFEIRIYGNTTENSSAVLNASGTGSANYSSVTIFPTGNGFSINGNLSSPLIDLNGADNVTIDGRVMQTGSTVDLSINNSSTSNATGTSTIRFINDASNNSIKYCNIKGSSTGGANIIFSTTTGSTGNDNNTIDNNNITNSFDAFRPVNAIYSLGTSSLENSGNIISNNKIYDNFHRGSASTGIYIADNNSSWTISGNSFYETSLFFVPTNSVAYYAILINSPTGVNFSVSGNYIGSRAALCGGSPWIKTNVFNNIFYGIYINAGSGTASNIQNNTIRSFDWSNSLNGSWTGILVAGGDVNVGTATGNTIGNLTGNGSIVVTSATTNTNVYGISITSPDTVDCRNNNIGSITTANAATNASNIYGIYKNGTAGTTTISNNSIGSAATINSIYASSVSTSNAQSVFGIYNAGTGNITISGNSIANLTNGTTNSTVGTLGKINGITSINGVNTISANVINDLANSNANNRTTDNASVCGIVLSGAPTKIITGNKIYNLSNNYASFAGNVIGIYFSGGTGNTISSNFIHSLSVGINSSAAIHGIKMASGASIYSNNIISLGGNSTTTVYGIYQTGTAGNDNSIFFNTVYIGGNPSSGTNKSYALYSTQTANIRDFRNNILVNARSTTGGSNLHYALYIAAAGGTLTCDYNDYYVSGTGGRLGYYAGNKTTLPVVTGQDVNSFAIDPVLTSPGTSTDTDYKIGMDLIGIAGTGITTDYGSAPRNNPTMGAWERVVNKWAGTINNSFNNAGNWTGNAIPLANTNILFDNAPVNHCYLDIDRTVNNITNGQSTYRMVTNGHKLTIKGNLIFTGGAQIDASAASSIIEYAGTAAQTIETGQFLNEKTYDLLINNTPGVTLNTDFTVDNAMTINSGKLFTISAMKLLSVSGTLINNAGITGLLIKSNVTGDGKLINNTPSVPATVELFLTGGIISPTVGIYHYIVPPVASMSIGTVPTVAEVNTALGITTFTGNLLCFNEPATVSNQKQGWQYFDNYPATPPGFTSVFSTRGYNINLYSGNDVLKFKGQLNGPQHTFNISYTTGNYGAGWNLVGNPYPCDYDLNGVAGLGTFVSGMSNTVYYNNNGTYQYWNVLTNTGSTLGYTDIVPPMTGFYVVATNSSFTQLVLPVASKSAIAGDNRSQHKGSSNYDEKVQAIRKVKLVLSKETKSDETIVLLADDASERYNEHYDAFKLFDLNSSAPGIYSELNGTDYFMKAISGPVSSPVKIPLKVVVKDQGKHEINVTEFENLFDVRVTLKHGNIKTLLNKNSSYSFTSGPGTFTDFELIFGDTGIENTGETPMNGTIKAWYNNQYLYINSSSEILSGNCRIAIYDIQGKTVFNDNQTYIVPGETIQLPVNIPKGIYILNVIANNGSARSKFVVF